MSDQTIKQFVFHKGAAQRTPVSGTFELTPRCNLSCKMCYVHMSPEEQARTGKELTAEQWIQLGRDAVDQGMIYLLLTGGEPLLRPDFVEIYSALIQMGLLISVNTNGTLLTREIIDCFQKFRPEKVNVTLYGTSAETYGALCGNARGFEAAVRGVRMLKDAGIRVNLNTTFTRYNLDDMDAIIDFAKSEKIPVRMSSYIFPPVRNQHAPDPLNLSAEEQGRAAAYFDLATMDDEQRAKRKNYIRNLVDGKNDTKDIPESKVSSCMAGRGAFWISWDGNMYPCGMLSDFSQDVLNQEFRVAWHNTCESVKTMLLPAECSACQYASICATCAAVSQSTHGATNIVVGQMCERTKAYAKAFLLEN